MISRTGAPKVARVLLVAHVSRQAELADWLVVEGEGVGYDLHLAAPASVPLERSWDVVVLDGESLFDGHVRLALLRRLGQRPREASILFVCSRWATDRELADAAAWADDFIDSGWTQADRVRRRVQVVALAPWRRSAALRRRAEQSGCALLRVLPGCASEDRNPSGPGRARMTGKQARLISDEFNEGRRAAIVDLRHRVDRVCEELLAEVAAGRACPEAAQSIEETYRAVGSPVVAARFGGASAAVEAVWGTLRQLAREELAALERVPVES